MKQTCSLYEYRAPLCCRSHLLTRPPPASSLPPPSPPFRGKFFVFTSSLAVAGSCWATLVLPMLLTFQSPPPPMLTTARAAAATAADAADRRPCCCCRRRRCCCCCCCCHHLRRCCCCWQSCFFCGRFATPGVSPCLRGSTGEKRHRGGGKSKGVWYGQEFTALLVKAGGNDMVVTKYGRSVVVWNLGYVRL